MLMFMHFGASQANADLVCVDRPVYAPSPQTPASESIPFTVLFGDPYDFNPSLTDPSYGDDSFNYYLRIGSGIITYTWDKGTSQANDTCDISRTITLKSSYEKTYTETSSQSIQTSATSR
ncbi:hypothetical protein EST62_12730 [Chlorobaculum sp. 24CR]|nr:hypothetical protein EST62_12730 [Chlorobaculum sp. 24CR]